MKKMAITLSLLNGKPGGGRSAPDLEELSQKSRMRVVRLEVEIKCLENKKAHALTKPAL